MKIEICNICEGTGETKQCDYRGDFRLIKCSKCDGAGRVIVGSYKYTVPFTKDKSLLYAADSKIFSIIRELEKK